MRKTLGIALLVLVNGCIPLLILEWGYRVQLVETYSPELHTFNPSVMADDGRPTLLLMGDSFTASRTSYAGILQDTLQEWRVINAAVSGTGVLQTLYIAPRRFARFHPTILLYQVYVGNDLFDVRYPTNWHTVSFGRNTYWAIANRLRVVSYMNYRLRQVWATFTLAAAFASELAETFAVERYADRVKIYMRAEPSLLEDSMLVQGRRRHDYAVFLEALEQLLAYCKQAECRAYILVIPHVCQVDEASLTHMRQLGAHFTTPAAMRLPEYPFLVGLRERLAAWQHVHVLNPLPMLREAHTRQAVYYANDDHLNSGGQQAIAAFLMQQLHLQ